MREKEKNLFKTIIKISAITFVFYFILGIIYQNDKWFLEWLFIFVIAVFIGVIFSKMPIVIYNKSQSKIKQNKTTLNYNINRNYNNKITGFFAEDIALIDEEVSTKFNQEKIYYDNNSCPYCGLIDEENTYTRKCKDCNNEVKYNLDKRTGEKYSLSILRNLELKRIKKKRNELTALNRLTINLQHSYYNIETGYDIKNDFIIFRITSKSNLYAMLFQFLGGKRCEEETMLFKLIRKLNGIDNNWIINLHNNLENDLWKYQKFLQKLVFKINFCERIMCETLLLQDKDDVLTSLLCGLIAQKINRNFIYYNLEDITENDWAIRELINYKIRNNLSKEELKEKFIRFGRDRLFDNYSSVECWNKIEKFI